MDPKDENKKTEIDLKEKSAQDFINQQLNSNSGALTGSSISDLVNKESDVYKTPEIIREKKELPKKPEFDADGFPIIQNMRTYNGDIANAVQRDNLTMTKIAVAEQKAHGSEPKILETKQASPIKLYLLIGITSSILFLAGLGAVGFSLLNKSIRESPVPVKQVTREIIASEEKVTLSLTEKSSRQIINEFTSEVLRVPEDAGIRNIIPIFQAEADTPIKASAHDFINSLSARAPEPLLRSLYQEFFLGVHFRGVGEPFIIFFTSSYDISSSSLLSWEGFMGEDLALLFNEKITSIKDYEFKDKIILNQDSRSLEDEEGNVLFFYSIIDSNKIIFAKSSDTFKEILDRLRVSKLQ